MKKTEIILREDNTIYGEYDYIDFLKIKLNIINGKIKEQLYYRNEHGGRTPIDEFGCSMYRDFPQITKLLKEVIQAQMNKRIKIGKKKKLTESDIQEKKLFQDILEDERVENEKRPIHDNRTYEEKIAAWDDGGCSTGLNDD